MNKKLLSEAVGTLLIVLIGTGSVSSTEYFNLEFPQAVIGLGFGIAVLVPILLFGNISGAHLNPAVSIALFLKKEIDIRTMTLYIISQSIGAIIGSALVRFIISSTKTIGLTQPAGTYQESFILEIALTFVLMMIILISVNIDRLNKFAPYFIAITVALEAYFYGPICGASMNPARSLGPAVISQNFNH